MRLFISAPLSKQVIHEIREYQSKIALLPLSLTPEENLHITLLFIGEVPDTMLEEIKNTISLVVKTFNEKEKMCFVTPMVFEAGPDPRFPRLVWLTISASPSLVNLHTLLAQWLNVHDPKGFHPHSTIARASVSGRLDSAEIPVKRIDDLSYQLKEIHLMESKLSSQGSRYTIRASYPLGNSTP